MCPCRCQCVNLIKENNRWRYLPCLLENLAHSSFAFTYPFGKQLGSPTGMKFAPLSLATAFAIRVLPVPADHREVRPAGVQYRDLRISACG